MELYVHIPFCRKKCCYCSFASFPGQEAYQAEYVKLLLREARQREADAAEPIDTVYIGGGTPSLLSPGCLSELAEGLRKLFDLSHTEEFTVEANPGTVTQEWLEAAASAGVNRLSFGMQAYQPSLLQLLGRIHTFRDMEESVTLARKAGITNISLDLMFGIPTQSADDWVQTIEAALSLNPVHISAYGLIPEEGTPLFRDLESGLLKLPDPEEEREMYDLMIRRSAVSGFHQYEISNFAKDSFECRHNIGYWTLVPYLGLGVSAASMLDVRYGPDGMTYTRSVNPDTLGSYEHMICTGASADTETITPAEARFETVMLGLRLNRGVNEADFQQKHHRSLEQCYGRKMAEMEKRGLMFREKGSWKMTARGFDIQNCVLVELMDE